MSAVTTLRSTLAAALASSQWSVFAFPPATVTVNSCIIHPDDPYITPSNNGYITVSPLVNFTITLTKPLFDNRGNLNGMEDVILELFTKLAASSLKYTIGQVSMPAKMDLTSGECLAVDVKLSILSSWS